MYPSILFEDSALAVLEKGAGMVVNRAGTVDSETLQDWAEEHIKYHISDIKNKDESDFVKRSGIVHRLDRETSGIILCAKTEDAFVALQRQFKERTVSKTYTLLVHGHVKPDVGEIDAPVGRLPWNRRRFGVFPEGRAALTRYEVVRRSKLEIAGKDEKVTLMRAYPATGRTHQLRVHFKHMNHPVFGDPLYVGRKAGRADRLLLPRQFLHASGITFTHPQTGEQVSFESPLPPELVAITLKFT